MITNERIIDAYLCIIAKHNEEKTSRELRELRQTDFEQIRKVKRTFDSLWAIEKNVYGPKLPYYIFRKKTLDQWQNSHNWTNQTRNLYSGFLTKLTSWNIRGQSKKDLERLSKIRPGADLVLAYCLPDQAKTLFNLAY